MSDLISRQAAIDALNEKCLMPVWCKVLVKKMLTDLPSAEPHWIPVTERLPEDGTEVWVTTEMLSEVTRARWHKDSNLWCHPYHSDCMLALRPIAWMELFIPEPYKGGAE